MSTNRPPRLVAVLNPAAGSDGERLIEELAARDAVRVEVVTTTAPGTAAELAHKAVTDPEPPSAVVSVGGDGTTFEVASGLWRARAAGVRAVPPLLVAPGGTGNSVYRGLWNDEPWPEVVERVATGRTRTRALDLAQVEHDEEIVVLGSGSGLFAQTLLKAAELPGSGRQLLMDAALAAMAEHVPYPGRVTVDGVAVHEGGIVETIVGGFRYRGGLLNLVPHSMLDDGLLDVTVVTAAADMNAFAQAALGGDVYEVPGIVRGRGVRVVVERTDGEPLLYEHDGEVMPRGVAACALRVLPAALDVLTTTDTPAWFGEG
ncbi:diacylglycerol/lipid kinase family protein [Streptomyces sp. NPDC090025]|uniref:diacylglycerol/lipid kinase family protein n=1 Tax=Streptomyces sp. NPDC090025 TaxID=3365922 RepID=UPI003833E599